MRRDEHALNSLTSFNAFHRCLVRVPGPTFRIDRPGSTESGCRSVDQLTGSSGLLLWCSSLTTSMDPPFQEAALPYGQTSAA